MARSIEALVKPELLIWGRETAGLSWEAAAKKIGVGLERLIEWECGTKRPTVAKLRDVARVYKRPTAAFYLPEPPEEPELPSDYRRIGSMESPEYSYELRIELRKARYRRNVALDLLEEIGEEAPRFDLEVSMSDDPDELAKYVRNLLDVSVDEQFDLRGVYSPLNTWKNAVENLGVLVFQTDNMPYNKVELEDMRGVSIYENTFPVILINSADAPNGRTFTLIHEFIHLLLHNGGVCDPDYYHEPTTAEQRIEIFCNRVSGAVLVPRKVLLNQNTVFYKGSQITWSDHELSQLASRFSVSKEVILRRLLILGKTSQSFYEEMREEFRKPHAQQDKTPPSDGPRYNYRIIMRNNGLAYTRLVLEAYYAGHITANKVCHHLGMKIKHLKKIEQAIMQTA